MAINSTGRRVLVNKGIYDSTLQYYPMDAVYYEGSYYICIKECVGVEPTDTNYWGYSHSLGDIGISLGIRLSDGILYITDTITTEDLGKVSILYRGEYSSTATYASLDVVTYEGSSYICIKDTTGNLPTDTTYFGLLCEGTEGRGITSVTLSENKHLVVAYTDGTSKDIGEVVIHTPLDQIDAASINSDGHLILSKDDGTTLDAGYVRGPAGPTGPRGNKGEDAPREAVLFVTQTLTPEQQAQARNNIGAASEEETKRLSEEIVKRFATVADMLADGGLAAGQLVRTGGYYAESDGGHGEYLIVNEATENPYDTFETANGKYAVLQHNGHINAKQCGLKDNATDGGDAWIAYYNGTAKSIDINVKDMRVGNTVVLNGKTEIFSTIYPSVSLYWAGSSDAAVLSCFAGNGLHATAYQSTTTVKLHDIAINARTAKVGFCLVNIATSNIWNLYVYRGYIGFLMGNSWRNTFGRLHGSTQTYATFYQNEFTNTDIFDFSVLTSNGSINASVYEMMISVFSPNGALLMGHGSENVFHMIEASEITDGESGIGVRFGEHSGTVNTIYTENAVPGAHYDLYVDNLISSAEGYDYNKGLIINQVRGRRFYLNNNVTIGTLFIEDWIDSEHAQDVSFEGGEQAALVTILNMPAGKYSESNLIMPYGLNGVIQALQKMQQKHSYRLIETVTLDAETDLVRKAEPDGTPYNFDAVYMEIMLPANTAFPGCNMKFYTTGLVAVADPYLSSVSAGEDVRYMIIEVKNEDGFVREMHSKFDAGSNHQALYTTANKAAYKQSAKIVDIRTTQKLQPGTVITIYAY